MTTEAPGGTTAPPSASPQFPGIGSEARLLAIATLLGPLFLHRRSVQGQLTAEDVHAAAFAIEGLEAFAVNGELPSLPEPQIASATPHAHALTTTSAPTQPVNPMAARNPHSISLEAPLSPAATTSHPNLHPFPNAAPSVHPGVTAGSGTPIANTTGK